jgi:electron transfer flavoprotein alpha subunit
MVTSLYPPSEESKSIWVFLETAGDSLANVSLELLTKGRQLADEAGWSLWGLLMGEDVAALAETANQFGADGVVLAEAPELKQFTVEAFTYVACQALVAHKPSIFLLGATTNGRDLAGRLAVRLKTGLNADCTELELDSTTGILVCEVSGFGGGVLALIEMQHHRPQMATVRPGVFQAVAPNHNRTCSVIEWPVDPLDIPRMTTIIERVIGEGIDLTQAEVLVVGGRGIGERFDLIWELAKRLGGDVGGTRPPVDEGFIPRERQIGQTGVVCRPKIVLTFGVSGAFHFVVGIQDADLVIAVNSDPEAPIFEHADYCIVADALEVLPALIAALEPIQETAYA